MAEAYSSELRARVVAAYEAGEGTLAEIADRFALLTWCGHREALDLAEASDR